MTIVHKQNGFVHWIILIVFVLLFLLAGTFVFSRVKQNKEANELKPFTALTTPYFDIADMSQIGPYSSNNAMAGYVHNGLDFMAAEDMTEYRAISGGIVQTVGVFYDSSRSDTKPQVNVIVEHDKKTSVVYTFEPYIKDIEVANRQLSLMNVKQGHVIEAGQSLGKLIKTAPQSHVHVHISREQKEFCFANLFSESDQKEMLAKAAVAPNVQAQLCYE